MNRVEKAFSENFPPSRTPRLALSVLLLPIGVSPSTALPEQLTVITVEAETSHQARFAPAVQAAVAKGLYVADTTPAGTVSPIAERVAMNRHAAAAAADPPPADLRGPNNRVRRF